MMKNIQTICKEKKHSIPFLSWNRIFTFGVLGILVALILFDLYDCPINAIFGVECPGCGMTQAYRYLLHFEFSAAFHEHELFLIPLIVFFYQIFRKKIFIGKEKENAILLLFILAFLIRWIIKLI